MKSALMLSIGLSLAGAAWASSGNTTAPADENEIREECGLTLSQEDVQILERPWDPASGRWVYVMVLDPLNLDELQGSDRALAQGLLRDMDSYGEDYVRLGLHLLPLLPATDVVVPRLCDPDEWEVSRAVCVEVDDVFMGTFHVAEPFHRILNVYREDDRNTDYAMGAISSAIMAR